MPDHQDGHELLAAYARENSEAAFAALVTRYVGLVYSAALRHSGHVQGAEEIAQAVFIILARKANGFSKRTILPGWLYQTTRLTAANYLRTEQRRRQREQEAYMQSLETDPPTDCAWTQIAPLLDDALAKLGVRDRDAIVLRYFENKSAREIAATLHVDEAAAHKRVNRAVAKLRKFFLKRGVAFSATTIIGAVSANSVHAAPGGLAKTVSAIAISKGATATISTLTLVKETMKLMKWSNMKTAIIIGAAMILAAGTSSLIAEHSEGANKSDDRLYYNMLDDAYQLTHSVDQSKFVLRILIRPLNKSVRISDVHLTIQSPTKGTIPIELGEGGEVVNVPHDEMLRRENPPIEHQPTNRLNLTVDCYIPLPKNLIFHYNVLTDGEAEADKMLLSADKLIKTSYADEVPSNVRKMMERKIQYVVLYFPKASARKATATIISIEGVKKYTADASSHIKLKLDQKFIAENPEVELSEKPQCIAPDFWEMN